MTSPGRVPTGGSGALAREAARLYPGSSVIVFDTAEVVGLQLRPPTEEEAGPRVSFLAGGCGRDRRVTLHGGAGLDCEMLWTRVGVP